MWSSTSDNKNNEGQLNRRSETRKHFKPQTHKIIYTKNKKILYYYLINLFSNTNTQNSTHHKQKDTYHYLIIVKLFSNTNTQNNIPQANRNTLVSNQKQSAAKQHVSVSAHACMSMCLYACANCDFSVYQSYKFGLPVCAENDGHTHVPIYHPVVQTHCLVCRRTPKGLNRTIFPHHLVLPALQPPPVSQRNLGSGKI